jgi:predicted phage tail protein
VSDDDVEEYLDPDLDPTPGGRSGLVTVPRVVLGLHVVVGAALLTIAAVAAVDGQWPQAATLGALSVMLVVAGVAAARLVEEW